jgi:hypothetical protein
MADALLTALAARDDATEHHALCQIDLLQGVVQLVDATKLKSHEANGQHVF